MKNLIIREPIWKDKSIGINDILCKEDYIKINIDYKTKSGKKLFPDDYIISGEKAKKYPTQTIKNVLLRIVPINHLDIIKK